MLFRVGNVVLVVIVMAVVAGTTLAGIAIGRRLRGHREEISEPIGAVQAALLGFVGLLLAFGLTMAVGRYENRRSAIVVEANAIGTAFLRAQTIPEPQRTASIELLRNYSAERLRLAGIEVHTGAFTDSVEAADTIERGLWKLAGESLDASPDGSAVRLYVDSLNTMFDAASSREAAFRDRIPGPVVYLQLGGAAVALGVLGLYLATLGRRVHTALLAAVMVSFIVLVALDLDRPQQGFVHVPTTPLQSVVAEMQLEPSSAAPRGP
jgi:hypothetical protein